MVRRTKRKAKRKNIVYRTKSIVRRARRKTSGSLIKYGKPFAVGVISGTLDNSIINPILSKIPMSNAIPVNLAQAVLGFGVKKFLKFNPMGLTEEYINGKLFMAGQSGINVLSNNNNTNGGW